MATMTRTRRKAPLTITLKGDTFYVAKAIQSPTDVRTKTEPPPRSEEKSADPDMAAHALLRKHYKYLLPWVASKPERFAEIDNVHRPYTVSQKRTTDEFRQLSLSHFIELSAAIYRDVLRREHDPAIMASDCPWVESCTRTKQNESRMVLCRTRDEHFHRLVAAMVVEQARRIAEIRIRILRRSWLFRSSGTAIHDQG